MDLSSAVRVARTHVERLDEHHKVNMLEAALERGENLIEALLEANGVRIEQFEELKLAKGGFLPQTLAKMGQRKVRVSGLNPSISVGASWLVFTWCFWRAESPMC